MGPRNLAYGWLFKCRSIQSQPKGERKSKTAAAALLNPTWRWLRCGLRDGAVRLIQNGAGALLVGQRQRRHAKFCGAQSRRSSAESSGLPLAAMIGLLPSGPNSI